MTNRIALVQFRIRKVDMNEKANSHQNEPNSKNKSTERTRCCHDTLLTQPCFYCAQHGTYYHRDREAYAWIIHNMPFDLAFQLYERVKWWREASKGADLDIYFKEVTRDKSLGWSAKSLKEAYFVACEFPHLKEKKNRRLKFSIYQEIALDDLTSKQKEKLCKKAEEDQLKLEEVKKEEYHGKLRPAPRLFLTFKSQEDCIEGICQFFSGRPDIKEGTIVLFRKYRGR